MNRIFLSIVLVFLAIAGALLFQASQGGTSVVLLPSDLAHESQGKNLSRIRVGGRVADMPIDYRVEPEIELKFTIEDPGNNADKRAGVIPVVYAGIKPDMFAPGRDVIIDGDFDGSTLTATKLLTQCPSKYEPPSAAEMYQQPAS